MEVEMECPHCGEAILVNPASLMGELSAAKRDTSSERMREVVRARWDKVEKNKNA